MTEKQHKPKKRRGSGTEEAAEAVRIPGRAAKRGHFAAGAHVERSYALMWRQTVWGIGAALAAFLLGRCPLLFDARPLGIALLCAATHAIPYLYGGLMVSALTSGKGAVILCAAYTAALLIRILSRSAIELPGAGHAPSNPPISDPEVSEQEEMETETPQKRRNIGALTLFRNLFRRGQALLSHWFSESIYLRMMTACVCAFLVGLYTIIAGGFLYYDLFGAFFAMLIAPTATFLYAGVFPQSQPAAESASTLSRREIYRTAAMAALAFSILFSLREVHLLGICASAALGFALTLGLCRRRGLLYGLVGGVLCGLAHSPVLTPSFVLAALAFGLLQRFSLSLALVTACTAGLAWGFYPMGLEALSGLLPPFLAAALLLGAADKLLSHPSALFEPLPDVARLEAAERSDVERQRAARSERRMQELSEAFSSLAGIFFSLSDRLRRPGLLDLRRMCDRAFDAVCPDCPQRELCWGADYAATLTRLSRMAASLHEHGRVEITEADPILSERCHALPTILQQMNSECARMTEAALHTEKAEVFAMDFDGLSHILADAIEEQNEEFLYDEEMSERVRRAMLAMDLRTRGVLVHGKRRRQIIAQGVDASASTYGAAEIRQKLEEACGATLGELSFDLSDTGVTMRVSSRPHFSVRCTVRAEGAQAGICGDTVNVFDTTDDRSYALISDGMGTGQEAAFTSGMCSLFLEKMLMAGNRTDTALRMLNSMIRQKGGGIGMECSATVDLLELDLLTGKAVVLKSGACPTYVRRDDCLFKLHAQTAPIGILRTVDAQRISYDVRGGDVIIMLSDGIIAEDGGESADAAEDALWLLDLLADGWQEDLQVMAQTILRRAREEGSRDDLSVILAEIREEP